MNELNEAETRKIRSILSALSPGHPARKACSEGRSLIDIAHCIGMQPDVLRELLELNVAHRRRLAAHSRQRHSLRWQKIRRTALGRAHAA
jgi:hypothetical protein